MKNVADRMPLSMPSTKTSISLLLNYDINWSWLWFLKPVSLCVLFKILLKLLLGEEMQPTQL